MKILALEIETSQGRRRVQLNNVEVDPSGEMPKAFSDLIDIAWGLVRAVAAGEIKPPRNEA